MGRGRLQKQHSEGAAECESSQAAFHRMGCGLLSLSPLQVWGEGAHLAATERKEAQARAACV